MSEFLSDEKIARYLAAAKKAPRGPWTFDFDRQTDSACLYDSNHRVVVFLDKFGMLSLDEAERTAAYRHEFEQNTLPLLHCCRGAVIELAEEVHRLRRLLGSRSDFDRHNLYGAPPRKIRITR